MDMQDYWSFTCCLSSTFGSLSQCCQLKVFSRYYFCRCSSELAELVPLRCSGGRSTRYSHRLHDFYVSIPRCYKNVYVNSFFPHTRFWGSLPIECFPLTYDINGFKSRIKRYFNCRFFLNRFPIFFNLYVFFCCNCMPLSFCSALH